MTAAQLEAHNVLEQAEREVQLAKLALSEFVERKRALEEQIEFEEGLAETHAKEVENLKLRTRRSKRGCRNTATPTRQTRRFNGWSAGSADQPRARGVGRR